MLRAKRKINHFVIYEQCIAFARHDSYSSLCDIFVILRTVHNSRLTTILGYWNHAGAR